MSAIQKRRKELRTELSLIEKQIYDLETNYLEESRDFGNIFVGWNTYLAPEKIKVKKVIQNDERLFSLSSVTSPASKKEEKEARKNKAAASNSSNSSNSMQSPNSRQAGNKRKAEED
jgi:hypothetical protein